MNKSTFVILTTLFAITLFSCSQSENEATSSAIDPFQELQFEVVDSIMVDVLENLAVLDYLPSKDQYLMKKLRKGEVFVVNGKGEILLKKDIAGEGPNQIQMVGEGRFYGEEGYIFKEFSATMDFNLFDLNFQKTKKFQGTMQEMMAIFISNNRQTFSVYENGGDHFLFGEEFNSFSKATIDYDEIGAEFYNKANMGFIYDLGKDSIQFVNTYPNDWAPKKNQTWVGTSYPFLAFDPTSKTVASLPTSGNQLGIYELKGNQLVYEKSVELTHPDRDGFEAKEGTNPIVYPGFNDIKIFGEYQLVQFYTAMPEDIFNGFRAKGENYWQDPAYGEASKTYRKRKYIVVKNGVQIGIVNELPIIGDIYFGLPDGTLIVKAADGEVERDYNLFYKIRLVEE
ncbi:hypothetical protein [Algoriphagus antarcticus]|uniref:Cyclic nucleotide-binding domain-containing protein n=1 Tax=Algoriphagus antarcticus TaxID=238540 RepID=A0A3E0E850_9BACT|nr:hypothetical protein [Algoriphagus antarcticus]REG94428.1 hypothetical protein C8N25_101255 [Algoriphagus antarcticus]